MKTVKIWFVGFWDDFDIDDNIIINILKKHYYVVIDKDNPDYVFCSVFGTPYSYCNYDAIRIFCSGENFSPDFNTVDYAIGYDEMIYGDRFFRRIFIPMEYDNTKYGSLIEQLKCKHLNVEDNIIHKKNKFCNLIYSHERDDQARKKIFEKLCTYKNVDSAGTYLNNMPQNISVTRAEKLAFQSNYKFTIAFESVDMRGFFTEKIVDAFLANTIPIYMGDPDIETIFNRKAFINCNEYESFDEVLKKIIEIDTNDDLYLKMLREPIFANEKMCDGYDEKFEKFLLHIFEQDKSEAYRRGRGPAGGIAVAHEERLREYDIIKKEAAPKSTKSMIYIIIQKVAARLKSAVLPKT
mgnify:CR=1 FL=1